MKILPNKSEKESLLAFINSRYSSNLDIDKTHFSKPISLGNSTVEERNPNDESEKTRTLNTKITIWNDDYLSDVEFRYRRIHLSDQFTVVHGEVREELYIDFREIPTSQPERNQFLISKAKERYNLINFDKIDISVNDHISSYSVVFTAKEDSLLYTGKLIITLKKLETRLHLDYLDINNISGFTYPIKSVSDD